MRKWFKSGDDDLAERRAGFADLTEARLDECGHMMHFDQPERLAQVLEEFFGRGT
jgi:carboxypeptidase C (cathepsin A)